MKANNNLVFLLVVLLSSTRLYCQQSISRSGDTAAYNRMDSVHRIFYDLTFGNKPDLKKMDTSSIIKTILEDKNDIPTKKIPVYLKNHLKHFDPADNNLAMLNNMHQYDYSHCERLIERTVPFVRMFYTYYLVFPNEFKDSLDGVYIKVKVKNNKYRYFTDDFSGIDEKLDSRYIHTLETNMKYRDKMMKLYLSWAKKVQKYGLDKIRKNNIKPFDKSIFEWGFGIIPEDPLDEMK